MRIVSTIRSDAPSPLRAQRLRESQTAHAPAVMLVGPLGQSAQSALAPLSPPGADESLTVLAGDIKWALDPVTLSALKGLPKQALVQIDPKLGPAYDGAMLMIGDIHLIRRWMERDDEEPVTLVLDTVGSALKHADFAAQFVPALGDYASWIKTAGVIVSVGQKTLKAIVEFDDPADETFVAALQRASAVRQLGSPGLGSVPIKVARIEAG